jgi:hypothetical protein
MTTLAQAPFQLASQASLYTVLNDNASGSNIVFATQHSPQASTSPSNANSDL